MNKDKQIYEMLKTTGLPVAYRQFLSTKNNPAPKPPFLIFFATDSDNFAADNGAYYKLQNYAVELYTDKKDFAKEELIENLFDQNKIFYNKSETYLNDEEMYMIIYNLKI